MISDDLLAELKQILLEDYQTQLTDSDLQAFAGNLKGLFSELINATRKREKELNLIITKNDYDKNTTATSV